MTDIKMEDAPPSDPSPYLGLPPSLNKDDLMRIYYDRLFPLELLCEWLVTDNDPYDLFEGSRIFSFDANVYAIFIFPSNESNTISDRFYEDIKDAKDLRQFLVRNNPEKIDIGPIYNIDPERRFVYQGLENGFFPKERELVFDIDMNDYDDVRRCCKEGNICKKDWAYMAAAILVLDASLREDFGFEHILWIYSGRRGVHGWVCDKRARMLKGRERRSLAEFLKVYKGQERGVSTLNVANCFHPSISRAFRICEEIWFEKILPEQQLFESEDHTKAILNQLGDPRIEDALKAIKFTYHEDINQQKWRQIVKKVEKYGMADQTRINELRLKLEKVVLMHVYPRLDIMVTKTMNHLLKAPFCVHPKTCKICVPIDLGKIWEFNPENVPTLEKVVAQLIQGPQMQTGTDGTDLESYVAFFQRFIQKVSMGLK